MTDPAGKVKLSGEIERQLLTLAPGETFCAGEDGAIVITPEHTHADILRYIAGDIGDQDLVQLALAIAPAGRALLSIAAPAQPGKEGS